MSLHNPSLSLLLVCLLIYLLSLSISLYCSASSMVVPPGGAVQSISKSDDARSTRRRRRHRRLLYLLPLIVLLAPRFVSQCHRCGGTGGRPRGHGPGTCAQDRRMVIVTSLSRYLSLSRNENGGGQWCFSWRRVRCAADCEEAALRHAQVRTGSTFTRIPICGSSVSLPLYCYIFSEQICQYIY